MAGYSHDMRRSLARARGGFQRAPRGFRLREPCFCLGDLLAQLSGGAVGRMGAGANDRNIPYSALDLICASHTTDGTCSTVGATSWTDDVSASASTPQTGADADRLFPGSGTFTTETGSPTSTPGYTGAGSRWQEPWSGTEEECEESAGTCAGADPDVPGVTTKALCDAASSCTSCTSPLEGATYTSCC